MLHPFAARLVLALVLPIAADDLPADGAVGRQLLAEGDALADKGEPNEAVFRYKKAFEQILPGMRKIRFRHEVRRDVTAREDMPALFLKEFEADTTPEELRAGELGMKALGLLPKSFDYKNTMVKVLSEEVAAFYDPKTKTMHLIREPEAELKKAPSFLERLFGRKGGFDKAENKTVIAHELTHALADQNYDLDNLLHIKDDDDRQLAVQALIEGEATLTMLGVQAEDWDGKATARMSARDLEWTFNLMMPFMPMAGGKALRDAPPIIAESLLFPYLRGVVFCAKLTNDDGWAGLDAAYKEPPLSTEQILHPEKFKARPDPPTAIDLGPLDPGDDWKEVGRNVVGEMQLAVLLRRHDGKRSAAGWDGDQYAVFEGPEGRLGLVWLSTWDSEDDAREFQANYARFQTAKLDEKAEPPPEIAEALNRNRDGVVYVVERRGPDVAVVEGFPAGATDRLVTSAFAARKAEKTRDNPAPQAGAGR